MKNGSLPELKVLLLSGCLLLILSNCKKEGDDQNNQDDNIGIIFNSSLSYGTITDGEGNRYRTIEIGTQT